MDTLTKEERLDNIIYLESSSGAPREEVLVSKSTKPLYQPNEPTSMNTQTNNRPLIIAMIIIGFIIIVLLLSPRYSYTGNQAYSYPNTLTASVVPLGSTQYNTAENSPGHYTRTITYTEPKTTQTTYTTYPTTTYTTYPTSTQYYDYPQQNGVNYDSNGCSTYANYSVTTGWPCHSSYQNQYDYPQQYNTSYNNDGCSAYANYSVTTGWPCR